MAGRAGFGRPKNYPHIQDTGQFVPDMQADHEVHAWLKADASPGLRQWYDQNAGNLIPAGRSFYHREPAQYNDPRVLYIVLDAVIRSQAKSYIRPQTLSSYIQVRHAQYYWSSIAVGRVLAGIHAACLETYGVGLPDQTAYVEDAKWLPFAKGRDSAGSYFVIDPHGGNEGRLWLMACRRKMFTLSEAQQGSESLGIREEYYGHGNAASVTYAGGDVPGHPYIDGWLMALGPIRTKEAFDASLDDLSGPAGFPDRDEATPDFGNAPNDGSGVRVGA